VRVLVVDESPERGELLREGLRQAGHEVTATLSSPVALLKTIDELAPDVIVIDTESPSRDVLEHLVVMSQHTPRPVVMFSSDATQETIRNVVRAGVSAYVVDGLSKELDEESAFALLRKTAMDRKQKLAEVARDLLMHRNSAQ